MRNSKELSGQFQHPALVKRVKFDRDLTQVGEFSRIVTSGKRRGHVSTVHNKLQQLLSLLSKLEDFVGYYASEQPLDNSDDKFLRTDQGEERHSKRSGGN